MFSGAPESKPIELYSPNTEWVPNEPLSKIILQRRRNFEFKIRHLFALRNKIKNQQNLLPNQTAALQWLIDNNQIIVLNADKNLGPVVMEREKYIKFAYHDHLYDKNTYLQLTEDEANRRMNATAKDIFTFTEIFKDLDPNDAIWINRTTTANLSKPSFMYLLAKIHKQPLKTRAIISYSGSLCHGLAKWLSVYLKKILKHLPYVATSSAEVVKQITSKNWNSNSTLFTMDAVSMYTNIHLGHALPEILGFLEKTSLGKHIVKTEGISLSQLDYALTLIMTSNIFQFGDTFWSQIAGTAMGTPPAPDYATLYFAIHEYHTIKLYPEISYYTRYIDDGFAIWTPNLTISASENSLRLSHFRTATQSYGATHEFFSNSSYKPLQWTFESPTNSVIFLDLRITLIGNTINTTIYEKELNLYLYLPPHSCHPPGMLKGLIFGFAHRAKSLCTNPLDRMPFMKKSYCRLLARGYTPRIIKPIFQEAICKYLSPTSAVHTTVPLKKSLKSNLKPIYLHLPFNPADPTPKELQTAFNDNIIKPVNEPHLTEVPTHNSFDGYPDFDQCIICYHGQRNLGNILSPRKHRFGVDFSVHTYLDQHHTNTNIG